MECNKAQAVRTKETAEKKLLERDIALTASNQTGGFSTWSSARNTASVTIPSSTRPGTSTSQQYDFTPRNAVSGTSSHDICHHTSAPGTSISHVPNYPKTQATLACNPQPFPSYQQTPVMRPPVQQPFCPRLSRPETFWTSCSRCRTVYEYHKVYLNQNLQCHCCQQYFLAMERPAPISPWPVPRHHDKPPVKKKKTNLKKDDSTGEETTRSSSVIKRGIRKFQGKARMGILGLLKEWEDPAEPKRDGINRVKTEQSRDDDESVSMAVPDANFRNFDEERIEMSFSENQVWAAYDDDDGMPRYYALVHRVISRKPF